MKLTIDYKCQCGVGNGKLLFKRPGFCETSLVNFTCPDCYSQFLVSFKRPKGKQENPNKVVSTTKIIQMSPVLKQILIEEATAWTAPSEE